MKVSADMVYLIDGGFVCYDFIYDGVLLLLLLFSTIFVFVDIAGLMTSRYSVFSFDD